MTECRKLRPTRQCSRRVRSLALLGSTRAADCLAVGQAVSGKGALSTHENGAASHSGVTGLCDRTGWSRRTVLRARDSLDRHLARSRIACARKPQGIH
jgi:hypothetical protein